MRSFECREKLPPTAFRIDECWTPINAGDEESAAEVYAEEVMDAGDPPFEEITVEVRDSAGGVSTWAVAVEWEPSYTARRL